MKAPLIALKEIVASRGGGTPSKKVAGYWDGDIPWATVKDFKGLKLSETQDSISSNGLKHSSANLIPKGHVIIPTRMALGKAAINTIDLAINQDLRALIPKRKIHTEYLLYAILGLAEEIEKRGSGATVKGITQENLLNLKIPFPKLEDQIRIAILLSRVNALITKRKDNLRLLDEFLKSTFLEMFGIRSGNYKKWKTEKLSQHAEIISGVTKGKKYQNESLIEMPYMRVANVQDGRFDLGEIKTIAVTEAETVRYQLLKGDVLLTEGGDPDKLGRGSVWEEQIKNCIHQNHIFRVRVSDWNQINPYYLSALIGSVYGKSYFLKAAKQTTGIASINSTQLKKFPLVIPPIDLQSKYASIASKIESLKNLYQKNLSELENLYGTLSQKAFKGELDLSRIPLPTITANGHITAPLPSIRAEAVTGKAMSNPLAREKLLRRLFENFISNKKNTIFSLEEFWPFIEEKVLEHTDEDSPPFGIADYDQVKQWLFDLLESGGIDQRFNEASNRLELSVGQ